MSLTRHEHLAQVRHTHDRRLLEDLVNALRPALDPFRPTIVVKAWVYDDPSKPRELRVRIAGDLGVCLVIDEAKAYRLGWPTYAATTLVDELRAAWHALEPLPHDHQLGQD